MQKQWVIRNKTVLSQDEQGSAAGCRSLIYPSIRKDSPSLKSLARLLLMLVRTGARGWRKVRQKSKIQKKAAPFSQ